MEENKKIKKPWYKKWWIWVILGILSFGVFVNAVDGTETTPANNSSTIIDQEEDNQLSNKTDSTDKNKEDTYITCQHIYEAIDTIEQSFLNPKTTIYKCKSCNDTKNITEGNKISPVTFEFDSYEIDFLGGIEVNFNITNNTNKEIKYINFSIKYKNAVGDYIKSEISGKEIADYEVTGPIASNTMIKFSDKNFYNENFNGEISLVTFTVTFMDNSSICINFRNINEYDNIFN